MSGRPTVDEMSEWSFPVSDPAGNLDLGRRGRVLVGMWGSSVLPGMRVYPPRARPLNKSQRVRLRARWSARSHSTLQYFDNEENLRAGADTFAAMDPSETPGSRVSVDTGELKVEREL